MKNCSIVIENEGFQKRIGRCESRNKKMAGEKERGNSDSTRDRSRGSKGEASRTPGYHRDFPREGRGQGGLSWPGSQYLTALNR